MNSNSRKIFLLFFLSTAFRIAQAQETIPASGGNIQGPHGSVSYTIGQIAYSPITTGTGNANPGVQQPYIISVVTGLKEASEITLELAVYPNPATDELKLSVKNLKTENLNYMLFDVKGNLLKENEITGNETLIHIEDLLPATYFLKINDNRKELKIFKIIKTNQP